MTWYLYDTDGYVGDLASGVGLSDFREFIFKQPKTKVTKTRNFINQGFTKSMDEVKQELGILNLNDNVSEVINNLISLLDKCNSIAIINNGISSDSEDN